MSEKPCWDHYCFHVFCYKKSHDHYHLNDQDKTCVCRICFYKNPKCENCGSGIYKNVIDEPKGTCKYCEFVYDYSLDSFETNYVPTEEDKLNHINHLIKFMYENEDVYDRDPSTRYYIDILDKLGVKLLFKYSNKIIDYYCL